MTIDATIAQNRMPSAHETPRPIRSLRRQDAAESCRRPARVGPGVPGAGGGIATGRGTHAPAPA